MLFRSIETVIVMDPDCRFTEEVILAGGLERRIFEFQRSRMAALTPRVRIRDAGVLPALQALEYGMTFSVLRKSLGDHCVTSGVAIYRRDALESAPPRNPAYFVPFGSALMLFSMIGWVAKSSSSITLFPRAMMRVAYDSVPDPWPSRSSFIWITVNG